MLITEKTSEYIKEKKADFFNNEKSTKESKEFIPELLDIKKEIDELFSSRNELKNLGNFALSNLISKDIYPKHLSNYLDFNMRNGFKGKSEEEIEKALNDIISIFKVINSKLLFIIESEKRLSNRLIKGLSLSINSEKIFISKLKQEYGMSCVNKMSWMLKDLETNNSEMELYKISSNRRVPKDIRFVVTVLFLGAWNLNQLYLKQFEIPPFLKLYIDDFQNYY